MIFKVIIFFVVTSISTLYPMERHTHSPSILLDPSTKKQSKQAGYKTLIFNDTDDQADNTAIEQVLDLLRTIKTTMPKKQPVVVLPKVKPGLSKITVKLSDPLDKFAEFKSGRPLIKNIERTRAAINQLAHVLELTVILIGNEQLPDLYKYLSELKATFTNVPSILTRKTAKEIVAYYIEQCYQPLVEESVTGWFNKTPQLQLNENIKEILTSSAEQAHLQEQALMQLIEILQKLSVAWGYYARLFTDNDFKAMVTLLHPNAELSIQTWLDITINKAKELYSSTKLHAKDVQEKEDQRLAEIQRRKQAKEEEDAQIKAEIERRKQAELDAKEVNRIKLKKETDEFNAYKERVLQEFESSQQAALAEHAEAATSLMKASVKKTKSFALQEQATDLKVLKETTTISEPSIMLINDELDAAIAACETISADNIAEVEKTIVASLVEAYEWLQEPRDLEKEKQSSDDEQQPEPYDDSYLHLKYKFNQKKLHPQVAYILKKAVYAWNMYAFARYGGKLDSMVTLKFSAMNNPKKSIADWIQFTSKAGFSHPGQFKKILKQGPSQSLSSKFLSAYKWIRDKTSRKPTPKLSEKQAQELADEVEADALLIAAEEKAGREKIRRLMTINQDLVQHPQTTTAAKPIAPTSQGSVTRPTTEKTVVTKPKHADFDPDFAEELRGIFAKQ